MTDQLQATAMAHDITAAWQMLKCAAMAIRQLEEPTAEGVGPIGFVVNECVDRLADVLADLPTLDRSCAGRKGSRR